MKVREVLRLLRDDGWVVESILVQADLKER